MSEDALCFQGRGFDAAGPIEEIKHKGVVVLDGLEDPDKMVGFEMRFEGRQDAVERFEAALLDGGGDPVDDVRVSDGGFLGGVVGKRPSSNGSERRRRRRSRSSNKGGGMECLEEEEAGEG